MPPPERPKIYHIVHVDRLPSIIADDRLWSDAAMLERRRPGTGIGMSRIKERRLGLPLASHPGLRVGHCVPFYFCPRSVMLFVIFRANNAELPYRSGQDPIIHLECDLIETVAWAERKLRRWAFTLSNAGSTYFEDRCRLEQLDQIDWDAVKADRWAGEGISWQVKEGKQAEFLVERSFPWPLVRRIGVLSRATAQQAILALSGAAHRPAVEIRRDWYY